MLDVCSASCLHSNGFEQAGVPERQLHHLFNLSHLFTTTPDIIIPDVIQALLLILTPSTYNNMTGCGQWNGETTSYDEITHTSRLIGSPSQWMMVSGATMQWGAGSVSTTLNSTALMPPLTRKISSAQSIILKKTKLWICSCLLECWQS